MPGKRLKAGFNGSDPSHYVDAHGGSYRYGFQNQEVDNEIKGNGNSVNYKYRMHDPRVGRFFAVDPLASKYPFYSPYSFSGNKVIHAIELEGLEELILSNLNPTRRPTMYVNNDSDLQSTIMFVLPTSVLGVANTITRPVTAREASIYSNLLNRNSSKSYPPGVEPAQVEMDGNGQFIERTASLGTSTANTSLVTTDPANTTSTFINGDFGATAPTVAGSPAGSPANQQFNIPVAGGATNMTFNFDDGSSHLNNFTITDASTGTLLGTFSGVGSATVAVTGVTNVTLTVSGSSNTLIDGFTVDATSSGPNSTAININQPAINRSIALGSGGTSSVTQNVTPIAVQNGVSSTPATPINR